jgi:hypothetical protein
MQFEFKLELVVVVAIPAKTDYASVILLKSLTEMRL